MIIVMDWYTLIDDTTCRKVVENVIDLNITSDGREGSVQFEQTQLPSTQIDLGDDWNITVFTDNGVQIEPTQEKDN